MKTLVGAVALLIVTGCSVISPRVGPQLAKAVNKYCATLSEEERMFLRNEVNLAIAPNEACVYCAGDSGNHCLPRQ